MPYQDLDDIAVAEPLRSPSSIERWLRKIFIDDWGLKLLALAVTLLLWVTVTDVNKPRTIRTSVQLNFLRPDNLNISNETPKSVDVLLTGTRDQLKSIKFLDLVATVDLSDDRAGERVIRLSSDRVHIELPQGVKIESFQPSTIPIRLELRVSRQLPIEVKLDGQPAEGFEVYGVHTQPDTVSVRGPASLVDALKKAPTESISIEGRKESFSASHVAIDIPDQKVDLVDTTVDVVVEIGPKRSDKGSQGAPLRSSTGTSTMIAAITCTQFPPVR
ncbi:MAG: CdaR family protein [Acidobacteriota bacterium]